MIRITKSGFVADDLAGWQQLSFAEFIAVSLSVTARARTVIYLSNTTPIEDIFPHLTDMAAIVIEFPSVTDGRGFSFSRLIREAGFTSRLRAVGLLLPHQFRHLLQTGFDEYLASEKTTVRFPEPLWIEQVETSAISYQDRLSDSSAFSQKIPSIGEYKGRDRRVQRRYDRRFRG